jgi:hypothetical protein
MGRRLKVEMDAPTPPRQQDEDALRAALTWDKLPRSAAYDPRWMLHNLWIPASDN